MGVMKFWIARKIVVAAAICVWSTSIVVAGTLQNENLLTSLPPGFHEGFHDINPRKVFVEYVPAGETVQSWTKMITTQIMRDLKNFDAERWSSGLAERWKKGCPGGEANRMLGTTENGYPVSIWLYTCPLNPATQKPETMWAKVFSGADAFYNVQVAYRSAISKDLTAPTMDILRKAMVCDTRRPDRPCPPSM